MSLMTSLYVPCASSPQHRTVEKVQSAKPLGSLPKGEEKQSARGLRSLSHEAGHGPWLSCLGPPGLGVLPCSVSLRNPVPLGAYESMLLVVPIRDIMPLGQKSLISRLPRRGWVMVTVTATCSRVLMPESSRSAVVTGKEKAGFAKAGGRDGVPTSSWP